MLPPEESVFHKHVFFVIRLWLDFIFLYVGVTIVGVKTVEVKNFVIKIVEENLSEYKVSK